jgi:hypothetical protein
VSGVDITGAEGTFAAVVDGTTKTVWDGSESPTAFLATTDTEYVVPLINAGITTLR